MGFLTGKSGNPPPRVSREMGYHAAGWKENREMTMEDYRYFGTYATFTAADKTAGELLQGADFIVGDTFDIEFRSEAPGREPASAAAGEGSPSPAGETAWVRNRFGGYAGYLDPTTSRTLRVMAAQGRTIRALLSLVAFTDTPEPGFYWGQVALLCYDPAFAGPFEAWTRTLSEKLAEGARVQVALTPSEVDRVIETNGAWVPTARADIPKPATGKTAILKQTRSASERMIELGRQRRPGCMVAGWVFNIALVAGIVALVLHLCGVF